MLFLNTPLVLEDIDKKKGIVRAYWSALGNRDAHGDILDGSAYDETIVTDGPQGRNRIKMLWQHSYWQLPLGVPTKLEVNRDGPGPEGGLLATCQVSKTQMGTDVLILYADGVITEHSVGIDPLERDEDDTSRILKVKLWEGSPVVWGANPLTPTIDVKSLGAEGALALLQHHKTLSGHVQAMRKVLSRSSISDETGAALDATLTQLEMEATAIEDMILQPSVTGKAIVEPDAGQPDEVPDWHKWLIDELGLNHKTTA